jgi:membrane protein required for colicin V production
MAWIDIVIVIIVMGLIIHGIATGLIRSAFDIAGIFFGYIFAVSYSATIKIPHIFAFLLIFIVVFLVVSIAGRIVSKVVHITPLGIIDRILGGALGLLKGVVICFVLLIAVMLIRKDTRILSESTIAREVADYGVEASKFLPRPWYEWLMDVFKRSDVAYGDKNNHFPF